jgi:hypothetical protein
MNWFHNHYDLVKVYIINAATFTISTFTNIELALKLLLLIVSILYTCFKFAKEWKSKEK